MACPATILDLSDRVVMRGKTVDISAGGVRVLGPAKAPPKAGTQVKVIIDLPVPKSSKKRQVERQATIRRVDPMGEWTAVALEFTSLVDL